MTGASQRWVMSFADLCLVLLAFLLLLQAHRGDPRVVGAGLRAAFGGVAPAPAPALDAPAAPLFEPGEAVLLAPARARLVAIGRAAAERGARVRVESAGQDGGGRRFDGWELAAARTAAAARAVADGGLDPARVDLAIAAADGRAGQRLRVTTG